MTAGLRAHVAAVGARVMAAAPAAARTLGWDVLVGAPRWLALPAAPFMTFQCRVGAVLCTPSIRLWIDRGRLAAAEQVLGADFLKALRAPADPTDPAHARGIPDGLPACPEIDSARAVEPVLRVAGASVLMATLRGGALHDAGLALLGPVTWSTMAPELAAQLVARAEVLAPMRVGA